MVKLRIALVQNSPVHGDWQASVDAVDIIVSSLSAENRLDAVILPELAFTGYTFDDTQHIRPLAELASSGRTFRWAQRLAARVEAPVVVGYPECTPDGILYNSQMAVGPDGALLANHRKAHLFATDKTWAAEGPDGFALVTLPRSGLLCSLGICMVRPRSASKAQCLTRVLSSM